MHKIVFILIMFISYINANSGWDPIWDLEQKSPFKLSSHQVSPNGLVFASLHESTDAVDEGVSRKQYLQIGTLAKNWWMSSTSGFFTISKINFIDNKYLLIIQNSTTVTLSSLINTETKHQRILGDGAAEYIDKGKNKGLFIFHGSKGYFTGPEYGAFWVDKVRNKQGELIEVLSKPKNSSGCIPLKSLLNQKETYPSLRQKMEDCVYVDR